MVFPSALLSLALLATTVIAAPGTGLAGRLARRTGGVRRSAPNQVIQSSVNGSSNTEYSSNWAGAVYDEDSDTFKAVTGKFTVPTPKKPSGSSGTHAASAWVGIDGDTCETAILQTGVDFTVDEDDNVSFDAWYEWYPDYAYDFEDIDISSGDEIKVTVTASSKSEGKAVIENLTTGKTVSKSLSSSYELCEKNAEWIVEDFEEGDSLVKFADFGTVTFSDAEATTSSGTVGPSDATIIDIEQDDDVLTSVSVGDAEVVVKYK